MLKFLRGKTVSLALNDQMCPHAAHGAVWVRKIERTEQDHEGYTARNFRADKPDLLAEPSRSTIRDIYEQMRNLGYELMHIEVRVNGEPKLYAL